MTGFTTQHAYGVLTEPATSNAQRLLPDPIERVWAYLTKSDLRRQCLTTGRMSDERQDAEPDHRTRSATQALNRMGQQRRS
jgi:uncharacterized protein YndB with AHSA1/START domain